MLKKLATLAPDLWVSQFHTGPNPKFSDAVRELSTVKDSRVDLINNGYRAGPNSTIYHLELLDVNRSFSIKFNRP